MVQWNADFNVSWDVGKRSDPKLLWQKWNGLKFYVHAWGKAIWSQARQSYDRDQCLASELAALARMIGIRMGVSKQRRYEKKQSSLCGVPALRAVRWLKVSTCFYIKIQRCIQCCTCFWHDPFQPRKMWVWNTPALDLPSKRICQNVQHSSPTCQKHLCTSTMIPQHALFRKHFWRTLPLRFTTMWGGIYDLTDGTQNHEKWCSWNKKLGETFKFQLFGGEKL